MANKYLNSLSKLKKVMREKDFEKNLEVILDVDEINNSSILAQYTLFGMYELFYNPNYNIIIAIEKKKKGTPNYCMEIELNTKVIAMAISGAVTFLNEIEGNEENLEKWLLGMMMFSIIETHHENIFTTFELNKDNSTEAMIDISKKFEETLDGLIANDELSKKTAPWGYFTFDLDLPFTKNIAPYAIVNAGTIDYNVKNNQFDFFITSAKNKKTTDFDKIDFTIDPNRIYSDIENTRLTQNALTSGYVPTEEDKTLVSRVYNSITKRGFGPSLFLYGEAGTGKSEKGKYISSKTGIPYTFVCCSATTNESDLKGKPQSLGTTGGLVNFFKKGIKALWDKDIDTTDSETSSEIKYSQTELVMACKYGWIVEIQEATLIVNAGTLGFLNCVLDNNRTLHLPDGSSMKVNPNTVFIFTTNLTYEGCNLLNNALLSRMNYVIKVARPSFDEQVKRVQSVTGYEGPVDDVKKIVQCIGEINELIKDNEIDQGVSDLRCAIECITDYKLNGDSLRESAKLTIEDKAILEPGYEKDVKNKLDSILGKLDDNDDDNDWF